MNFQTTLLNLSAYFKNPFLKAPPVSEIDKLNGIGFDGLDAPPPVLEEPESEKANEENTEEKLEDKEPMNYKTFSKSDDDLLRPSTSRADSRISRPVSRTGSGRCMRPVTVSTVTK